TAIAEQIIDKGGDYVLCVKANQSLSLQEIEIIVFQHLIITQKNEAEKRAERPLINHTKADSLPQNGP
ncbi:MAG: hypothetical protein ACFNO3_05495, partial [Alloprevotella tannerae]